MLAVGDSMTEYLAAKDNDIAFLGVVSEGANNLFPPDVTVPTLAPDPPKERA